MHDRVGFQPAASVPGTPSRRSASSGQTLHFPGFLGYSAWLDSGRLAGHLGSADPLSVVQKGA
jgi:hypothetical protein